MTEPNIYLSMLQRDYGGFDELLGSRLRVKRKGASVRRCGGTEFWGNENGSPQRVDEIPQPSPNPSLRSRRQWHLSFIGDDRYDKIIEISSGKRI